MLYNLTSLDFLFVFIVRNFFFLTSPISVSFFGFSALRADLALGSSLYVVEIVFQKPSRHNSAQFCLCKAVSLSQSILHASDVVTRKFLMETGEHRENNEDENPALPLRLRATSLGVSQFLSVAGFIIHHGAYIIAIVIVISTVVWTRTAEQSY